MRFHREVHSSTVMIFNPLPTEGLISTGSPDMIFLHSVACTLALGSAFTSVYTSVFKSSAYACV